MPRLRRRFIYNGVYFVSNRVAHGLPFVACLYINLLLFGVLVRAMFLYPQIIVCSWIFLGNHYHGIVILKGDPEHFELFMKFVDGEIAKIINRLRGVSNQNVWAGRYDAQHLITAQAVVDKMAYLYLNPARANLIESIARYPGLSTWNEFSTNKQRFFKWIGSAGLKRLPRGRLAKTLVKLMTKPLEELDRVKLPFVIKPFAWKECFEESKNWIDNDIRNWVVDKVSSEEKRLQVARKRQRIPVLGAETLSTQDFFKRYSSKTYGRRSICISTCPLLRKLYLAEYRAFCEACKRAYQRWKLGDFTVLFPPGAFRPKIPPNASLVFG